MHSDLTPKGRGAVRDIPNRFEKYSHEIREDFVRHCLSSDEQLIDNRSRYLPVYPKTIVNKVASPDVGVMYSLNPYQGCEHGCAYCYARPTHEYWGNNAGLDFEKVIYIKHNAPDLLQKFINGKTWRPTPISLSGNTDCYQPAERRYKLTRACLEVFLKHRHPVGIITKNHLALRDLELLKALAELKLVRVVVSMTTLSEGLRRVMEPRTSSVMKRLEMIRRLSEARIPVSVLMAPIIPSINSHEVLQMAKAVAHAGALDMGYTIVRINGAVEPVFTAWLHRHWPSKADRVLKLIRQCHAGQLADFRIGTRMKGEGQFAEHVRDMMQLAKHKYFKKKQLPEWNTEIFQKQVNGQLQLNFDRFS